MSLYLAYFSPTGGTKKCAKAVTKAWYIVTEFDQDKFWEEINLCKTNLPYESYCFEASDILLAAVPSFGGRVPSVAGERLSKLKGNGARAILLCAYGNRAYEDTLVELQDILTEAGFKCMAAVAAVAEHSIMHEYAKGRPDKNDKKILLEYGERIKAYLEYAVEAPGLKLPGNRPYKEYGGVPLKPKAGRKCISCGLCAESCPVGAISKDYCKETDHDKCISCMRCIAKCPVQARGLNPIMLATASTKLRKACAEPKRNELYMG